VVVTWTSGERLRLWAYHGGTGCTQRQCRSRLALHSATAQMHPLRKVVPTPDFLLHRVSAGETGAVRECIARFGGLIWTLARRVGLPESETEDAVHEIFTELWKHGVKYDPTIASETAFVATIARRRLIDRRRRVSRQPVRFQISDDVGLPAPPEAGGGMWVHEEARRASDALLQLTNEQQKVLRLSVYEGLSHEMIARSTGLPLGTVKTHARRGLMKLRELLGAGGSTTSGGVASGAAQTNDPVPHGGNHA
jgi:RNA polymerase sigma factor (sigma-70 family)